MIPHRIAVGLKHAGIIMEDRDIVYYVQSTVEIFNFSIIIVIYIISSKVFRIEYKYVQLYVHVEDPKSLC